MSNSTTTSASTISTITGAASESGRGQGQGGRGRGRGGRGNGGRSTSAAPSRSNFKGATDEMQGNVFECYSEQRDRRQFAKTMEILEIYSKKKFQHFQDLAPHLKGEV
jgi:hypothetical protein